SFLRQEVNFVGDSALNANKLFGYASPTYPGPSIFSITEQIGVPGGAPAGYTWGAIPGATTTYSGNVGDDNDNFNQRFSASYITGSHAFKAGLQTIQGHYYFT